MKIDTRLTTNLWLFFNVVPSVLRPVMWRDSLNIRNILSILNIWAALAIYSSEYLEERRLSKTERKKGRIPSRSMMLRNEIIKSPCRFKLKQGRLPQLCGLAVAITYLLNQNWFDSNRSSASWKFYSKWALMCYITSRLIKHSLLTYFVWRYKKANDVLKCEPAHKDGFRYAEKICFFVPRRHILQNNKYIRWIFIHFTK